MLTDASNVELHRINALAQERYAAVGELGAPSAPLPDRPYGLSAGDEVIFGWRSFEVMLASRKKRL